MEKLKTDIENAYEQSELSPEAISTVKEVISRLDQGELKVCVPTETGWQTEQWLKKAILLYFRSMQMTPMQAGIFEFYDKIPLKSWTGSEGVRVVPPAVARVGSFIEPGAILMPSYVNIGARVGSGTMIDTWATVGSCAQIGKNVHVSGGVGIGGVLEPIQANPVIVEDDCFLGSRCVVVEGVHLESGAVLGAGVVLTASTQIIDVSGAEEKTYKGRIPANSVVIPGSRPKKFPAGTYEVPAALIIGHRQESTDKKTSLTSVLRDFEISV